MQASVEFQKRLQPRRWGKLAALAVAVVSFIAAAAFPSRAEAAGAVYKNVTLTCYWISNYQYFHSTIYVTISGMAGGAYPNIPFTAKLRSDFVGPMTQTVDWNNATPRQHMSVRGMNWGQVDFGKGDGGPNGAWATAQNPRTGKWQIVTGAWYLYIDSDLTPGSYPKIQLMPQTRPANWYEGFYRSYDQVPFPQMARLRDTKVVACTNFLPMGMVLKITAGNNALDVAGTNNYLHTQLFEVLDMSGDGGVHLDANMGLQYFEAEQMQKFSIWCPGSSENDTRGVTIQVLGQYASNGKFTPAQ